MLHKIDIMEDFMDKTMHELLKLNPSIGNAQLIHKIMTKIIQREEKEMIASIYIPNKS
jgi:hypothetical protein